MGGMLSRARQREQEELCFRFSEAIHSTLAPFDAERSRPEITGVRARGPSPPPFTHPHTSPSHPAMAEILTALADGGPLARDRVLRDKAAAALDVLDRTLDLYG